MRVAREACDLYLADFLRADGERVVAENRAKNAEEATLLGRAIGEVVHVDVDERPMRNIKYVRVRVWIDPEKPLVSGFYLHCVDGSRRWITCRYERVCKLCQACGRIGHTYPHCDLMEEDARAMVDNHL